MKACVCHDVSDKTVRSILTDFFKGISIITKRRHETDQPHNLDDLHEACSGGEGFNCGKCACYMADLAREHNRNITMAQIRESLPAPAVIEKAAGTCAPKKNEPAA